jgi:hypothetical protein
VLVSGGAYRPEYAQLRGMMRELQKTTADKNRKFVPGAQTLRTNRTLTNQVIVIFMACREIGREGDLVREFVPEGNCGLPTWPGGPATPS